MIVLLIGIAAGIGGCEIVGRQLSGYSILMETVEWFRRMG